MAVDAAVSSTPEELAAVVRDASRAAAALGTGVKTCLAAEAHSLASRRGLYAARRLAAGDVVTSADVVALRPASELTPADLPRLVGVRLPRDVAAGAPFVARDLEEQRAFA